MEKPLSYTVKVINAGNSSGYVVKKWNNHTKFSNISDLKDQLASDFATLLQDGSNFLFGYIQRGHGVRGKRFSITEDKDILSMYDEYQGRREKVCKPHVNAKSMADDGSRKRPISADNAEASSSKRKKGNSNYQGHLSKMSEVEEIVEDLERRHGENNVYTPEQIRVWAHMIQSVGSYDTIEATQLI